uniref:Uncharacterized protein n=1 Tax=Anguilla anguilla TaxID=7936 RepID=A0A0E9TL05_ANGAN
MLACFIRCLEGRNICVKFSHARPFQ